MSKFSILGHLFSNCILILYPIEMDNSPETQPEPNNSEETNVPNDPQENQNPRENTNHGENKNNGENQNHENTIYEDLNELRILIQNLRNTREPSRLSLATLLQNIKCH